jgi:hypothetical protein
MTAAANLPDIVPVLSTGRHRNPRKGACFMEMASYLAGERWSDHPKCTHPLLASLARMVNDSVPDAERSQLVPLIPDVVGLTSDDLMVDLTIATRAAVAALPVAPVARQNVLGVGLLTCDRMLATVTEPRAAELRAAVRRAFDAAPDAESWAHRYARDATISARTFRRQTAPHIVAYAVEGISVACVPDAPVRLVQLLTDCIGATAAIVGPREGVETVPAEAPPAPPPATTAAGEPTPVLVRTLLRGR